MFDGRREQRVLLPNRRCFGSRGARQLLELLYRRHDGLARRSREQLAQLANALGPLGVGEAAGDERLRDLLVEIHAVGDDHDASGCRA